MTQPNDKTPIPVEIRLHQQSRTLELVYQDEGSFNLSHEFLRVFTPSAEARGHGPGQEKLQVGKRDVVLNQVLPVGHYALKLSFSDGHDSGLYTWELLHNLCIHHDALWDEYLSLLAKQGQSRDPLPSSSTTPKSGCGTQRGCQH